MIDSMLIDSCRILYVGPRRGHNHNNECDKVSTEHFSASPHIADERSRREPPTFGL